MLIATRRTAAAPDRIGALARRALLQELACFPKPGLVSPVDHGSHADMSADHFRASAEAIAPFLVQLARAGAEGADMRALRAIGLEAEAAMLRATGGVNTHRGAIFGLGLFCAAAGFRHAKTHGALGMIVANRWGQAIRETIPTDANSNGLRALRAHAMQGGARMEAAEGYRIVHEIGLPALAAGLRLSRGDANAARVHCLFALMARLTDTTLLHRGGPDGLAFAQSQARLFLSDGGVAHPEWRQRALALHRQFVARRLSPGGSADLLAMTILARSLRSIAVHRSTRRSSAPMRAKTLVAA